MSEWATATKLITFPSRDARTVRARQISLCGDRILSSAELMVLKELLDRDSQIWCGSVCIPS